MQANTLYKYGCKILDKPLENLCQKYLKGPYTHGQSEGLSQQSWFNRYKSM